MRNRKHQTQTARILQYLQAGQRLTPLEALNLFGSLRLGAIIFVLRERGHKIKTDLIEVPTRGGQTSRVARYHLERMAENDEKTRGLQDRAPKYLSSQKSLW